MTLDSITMEFDMLEFLSYAFMQKALLAGIFISIATSLIGVHLIQRRLSLLGDGIAHASFGGVAIGFLLSTDPIITALIFAGAGSLVIQKLVQKTKTYGDAATALLLSTGMAVAIVIIGYVRAFNANLFSYLFGSILTTNIMDLMLLGSVAVIVVGFSILFHRKLLFISFNEDLGKINGINTGLVNSLLVVLTALATVIAIRAVGILLVTGLLVIPSLTGLQLARSFKSSLVISVLLSLFSMIVGIFLAFLLDLPPSGMIVLAMIAVFAVSLLKR